MGRYVKFGALGLAVALYVWFAAVRSAGEVRSKKAAKRGDV